MRSPGRRRTHGSTALHPTVPMLHRDGTVEPHCPGANDASKKKCDECSNDLQCGKKQICCPNVCKRKVCMDPITGGCPRIDLDSVRMSALKTPTVPVTSSAATTPVRTGNLCEACKKRPVEVTKRSLPRRPHFAKCPDECSNDCHCRGRRKCCYRAVGNSASTHYSEAINMDKHWTVVCALTLTLCIFVNLHSGQAEKPNDKWKVKRGRCPLPQPTQMCAEFCHHDGECPEEQKCCRTSCGHACYEVQPC
ncbi:hypothetical protein WMY93_030458 [Mugilogobius chulae]|uniref:WAP domain-containing protein n=1 Tax=Mugilogobius chulae TaxID=88201 RepID=A0AAW0MHS1_9GOBI